MTTFEFVFSLFGLLLGFSLVEVLGGFARALRRRKSVEIGWLTPLLGTVVMLDLISFWSIAWSVRDALPPRYLTLLVGFLITGIYYLAASIIFPDDAREGDNLDGYYFEHRREVLGAVIFCNLISYALAVPLLGAFPFGWGTLATLGVALALALAAMATRSKRLSAALLAALVATYGIDAFAMPAG